MKKEIAEKWIKALRSGEYTQIEGTLRDETGFCCLGVLCDISNLSEWKNDYYLDSGSVLPDKVRDWAGMSSDSGMRNTNLNRDSLLHLNDHEETPSTFLEIANIIEKEYESL